MHRTPSYKGTKKKERERNATEQRDKQTADKEMREGVVFIDHFALIGIPYHPMAGLPNSAKAKHQILHEKYESLVVQRRRQRNLDPPETLDLDLLCCLRLLAERLELLLLDFCLLLLNGQLGKILFLHLFPVFAVKLLVQLTSPTPHALVPVTQSTQLFLDDATGLIRSICLESLALFCVGGFKLHLASLALLLILFPVTGFVGKISQTVAKQFLFFGNGINIKWRCCVEDNLPVFVMMKLSSNVGRYR